MLPGCCRVAGYRCTHPHRATGCRPGLCRVAGVLPGWCRARLPGCRGQGSNYKHESRRTRGRGDFFFSLEVAYCHARALPWKTSLHPSVKRVCRERQELREKILLQYFHFWRSHPFLARADLLHLGVRAPSLSRLTTVQRSPVICLTPTGKAWNDM